MLYLFYNRDFIIFIDTEFLIHNLSRMWDSISAEHLNFMFFKKKLNYTRISTSFMKHKFSIGTAYCITHLLKESITSMYQSCPC